MIYNLYTANEWGSIMGGPSYYLDDTDPNLWKIYDQIPGTFVFPVYELNFRTTRVTHNGVVCAWCERDGSKVITRQSKPFSKPQYIFSNCKVYRYEDYGAILNTPCAYLSPNEYLSRSCGKVSSADSASGGSTSHADNSGARSGQHEAGVKTLFGYGAIGILLFFYLGFLKAILTPSDMMGEQGIFYLLWIGLSIYLILKIGVNGNNFGRKYFWSMTIATLVVSIVVEGPSVESIFGGSLMGGVSGSFFLAVIKLGHALLQKRKEKGNMR